MRNLYLSRLCLLVLFVASNFIALQAQRPGEKYDLLIQNGITSTSENLNRFIAEPLPSSAELVNGKYYRIVQFYEIPSNDQKVAIENAGIQLLDYIPNHAFLAAISKTADKSQFTQFQIRSVISPDAAFKMAPALFSGNFPEWSLNQKGFIDVTINYYTSISSEAVLVALKKLETGILHNTPQANRITVRVRNTKLAELVALPHIYYVEPIDPPSEPENYTGRTLHRSNFIASDHSNGLHYDGTGVNVMMQDDGIIGPHIDYEGRLPAQFLTNNNGDHGDHVAGIIMGAGNIDPVTRGNAYGADLYVYGAAPAYPGFDSIYDHYNDFDIYITSTSYSNGCNAGYTSLAREMDQQVRTLPNLMHVFSAGNSGTSDCGYGAGNVWGNVTGGHKIGKNVIAVANLDEDGDLTGSSSRGPAHDGRIKPDISAKGVSVYSTTDAHSYTTKTGTSMSCPGVSGTLAQLYQAFEDVQGNAPKGGLIKAIALNSADDLGNVGPDFKHGWGQINARKAFETIDNNQFITSSVAQGANVTHDIIVPTGATQLRVMLYWTDFEAAANASVALVNDLNLEVVTPSTSTELPWILDPTPTTAALDAPATTGVDDLNNVEQVVINNPATGLYTVNVNGLTVPQGPQEYFIIYEFSTDAITLTYPIGGESFVPGETEVIRWDAQGNTGNFTLEYSINNGVNWSVITNNVNGSLRQFDWNVPTVITGQMQFRVSRGIWSDLADDNFSIISVPQGLSVAFSCPDSIGLTWNSISGATGYEASWLGPKYMDSIGTSTTNNITIYNTSPVQEYWFSVKALGPNGAIGRRAIAINKAPGVANCIVPIDVEVTTITEPQSGILYDCQEDKPLTIQLRNNGQSNVSNIPVSYQIGTAALVTETFTGTIIPNSTAMHTFATALSAPAGINDLAVSVNLTGDGNSYNDTILFSIQGIVGMSVTPIWTEDFETFTNCPTTGNCGGTNCLLANGWANEPNGIVDDVDWRTHNGATPSGQTGPSFDQNPGTGAGKYLYIEGTTEGSTNGCQFDEARLISPCIDLTNGIQPKLNYWYHMFGENMGQLHVDILSNGVWNNDVIPAVGGNQGNSWEADTIDLIPYNGQIINVRFRGVTGSGFRTDMALDNISVLEPPIANFLFQPGGGANQISFTDLSMFGDSIFMDLGDGTVLDSSTLTHTYNSSGPFTVTQIVTNACGSDTLVQEIVDVSVADPVAVFGEVNVFPNPSTGSFTLSIVNGNTAPFDLVITDLRGRPIYQERVAPIGAQFQKQIELPGAAQGFYYLQLVNGSVQYTTKLGIVVGQ